jgi:hypothetical protein
MIEMFEKQQVENSIVKQKKAYKAPELVSYGTVSDLTAASTMTNLKSDNGNVKGNTKT